MGRLVFCLLVFMLVNEHSDSFPVDLVSSNNSEKPALQIDISLKISGFDHKASVNVDKVCDGCNEDNENTTQQNIISGMMPEITTTQGPPPLPPCPEMDIEKECPDDFFMINGNHCKMCLPPCDRKACTGTCHDNGSCTCSDKNSTLLEYGASGCPQRTRSVIGPAPIGKR